MEEVRFTTVFSGKKALLVVLMLVLAAFVGVRRTAYSQSDKVDRRQIARQIAGNWIKVGNKQYERGFYRQAERSALRARDYEKHLSAEQRDKLAMLLEKSRAAVQQRKRVLESIQIADELIKNGQLLEAKTGLEETGGSEFLTKAERQGVRARIEQIDEQIGQWKKQLIELYNLSKKFYSDQQFEKARQGFIKVAADSSLLPVEAKKAQEYLARIEDVLAREAVEVAGHAEPVTIDKSSELALVDVAGPVTNEEGGVEGVNRKINILRSYTRAIVSDAAAKAQSYISQSRYDKAEEVIEAAKKTVNENRLPLGENLFRRYFGKLEQLAEKIVRVQKQASQQVRERHRLAEIAREARRQYTEAQRRYKEQIEAEKEERISKLMDSASVYLQQKRYKEAAEQLSRAIELIKKLTPEQPDG